MKYRSLRGGAGSSGKDTQTVNMNIETLREGMVAAQDVFNSYGTIIIRKNRPIEGMHIMQMRMSEITEIPVIKSEDEGQKQVSISDYPARLEQLQNATVLVVDDSQSAQHVIKKIVEDAGLKVVGLASCARDGIRMVRELRPTAVTLDINMPDMDGMTAITPILTINPETRIIMVSSSGYQDVIVEALEKGAVKFISKPYNPEILKKVVIDAILSKRKPLK